MPLAQVVYTHPNSGRVYHQELWEISEETLMKLREFLERDDVIEDCINSVALTEESATSEKIRTLLATGKRLFGCEPSLSIYVYWRAPSPCTCDGL